MGMDAKEKKRKKNRRHMHILKKMFGTQEKPRIIVYRSLRHFYVQAVDDEKGVVITGASTLSSDVRSQISYGGNVSAAEKVGELMAKRLFEKGIKKICFDRAGYRYHGRVRACAEGLRKGGIEF